MNRPDFRNIGEIAVISLVFVISTPLIAQATQTVEEVLWHQTPIPIQLTVDSERIVTFPGQVHVGIPSTLQSMLRVQSSENTVYLLATTPFDLHRLVVKNTETGTVYLLDVSASTLPTRDSIIKVVSHANKPSRAYRERQPHNMVRLTRFAAQRAFAPSRLQKNLHGLIPLELPEKTIPLIRGYAVESVPLASWRSGNRYLTVVRITNRSPHALTLKPSLLRGRWLAATFHHNRLLDVSSDANFTLVYLISEKPFMESL